MRLSGKRPLFIVMEPWLDVFAVAMLMVILFDKEFRGNLKALWNNLKLREWKGIN